MGNRLTGFMNPRAMYYNNKDVHKCKVIESKEKTKKKMQDQMRQLLDGKKWTDFDQVFALQ